jgi:hypothetical protein
VEEMAIVRNQGDYRALISIPANVLAPGRYFFTFAVYSPGHGVIYDVAEKAISLTIVDGGSLLANIGAQGKALTSIILAWKTQTITPVLDEHADTSARQGASF